MSQDGNEANREEALKCMNVARKVSEMEFVDGKFCN